MMSAVPPGAKPLTTLTGRSGYWASAADAESAAAVSASVPSATATTSLLGAAKKQMVEIARAVRNNAQIIIFDEPTATLTPEEKLHFFMLIEHLKTRGVTIIFISHALEEALQISDRITVLRDGKLVITDGVFSMEGDLARLPDIVELARALEVEKPPPAPEGVDSLLDLIEETA